MWHTIPIENLLLFLRSDTIVLIEKIKEWAFWFFECRICSSLKISEIRKNTLFELLRIFDGTSECLKPKSEAPNNIGTRNVKKIVPIAKSVRQPFSLEPVLTCDQTNHRTQDM
jgi:hypothetical protein